MKLNCKNALFLASISLTLTTPSAFAVNLYWDGNGTTAGAGTTPNGIWGTSPFWNTTAAGNVTAPTNAITTSADDLFFSAGTDATGTYAISLATPQSAKSLTFEDGTATIGVVGGGNTLTLIGGGITILTGSGTATVSCSLTIDGRNTFNAESGPPLTVNGTTFTRGTRAALSILGTVATPPGGLATLLGGSTIAPWASIGTDTSTQYATVSGGNITDYTAGTPAATAADVTDTTGTVNYDVADVGTLGAGASVNTLRYTGPTGDILGDLATKGIMNASGVNLNFGGAVTAGAPANELVVNTASGNIGFNGIFTGAINKTGSGTMTLSGTPLHSINAWTVNQGVLILNSALGAASLEVIPGGTVNSGATARFGASNKVFNGAIFTINAGGTLDLSGQGDLVGGLSGAGSVITTGTPTLQLGNTTQTFSGVISGGLNLVKRGGGEQILSGANTYTGTTAITNPGTTATLTLANPLALQNSALNTTITSAGNTALGLKTTVTTLTLGGLIGDAITGKNLASVFRTDSTGGPSGTTALGGYSGVTALTLNPTAVTRTYTAIIADGAPGMSLTKSGAATQVLSGINTYTGATAVNRGTLLVNSPGSLATASAVTVAGGASIGGNGTINGTVNVSAGGLLAPGGVGTIGTLTLANDSASSLTLNGNALLFDLPNTVTTSDLINITGASGALTLNGANFIALNAPSGAVPAGTYTLMTYAAQTGSGTLTFQNGTTTLGNATLAVGPTSVTLTVGVGGLLLGLDTWSGSVAGGVWDGGVLNWTKDGTVSSAFVAGDAVTFDDSGSTTATISSAAPVLPASVLFNNNVRNYTVSAVIDGPTTLTKIGSGTATLTGINTYTGKTTISGGTLQLNGGKLGNGTYLEAIDIAPGATFQNLGGVFQRLGGVVGTGGGNVSNNQGDLVLDNAGNAYAALNVAGGRVFINTNVGALPAAATVNVTSGTLIFGAAATRANAIAVSPGGTLNARTVTTLSNVTLPGAGNLFFNNDDADTVSLTINNGQALTGILTVQVGGSRMLLTGGAIGGVNLSGAITGSGSLVMTSSGNIGNPNIGTGVLTLSGANTYTGDTTVNSGTLSLGDGTTNTSLADAAGVVIGTDPTAFLNLNYSGTDTVATLTIDGVAKASGIWGSATSGAANTDPKITGTGTLTVGPVGGTAYATWAAGFPGFTPTTTTLDFEFDGNQNLLEFVFGGNPTTNDNPSIRPTVNASSADLVVTFNRTDLSETQPVTVKVQSSTDLVTWVDFATIGSVSGSGYTVTENGAAADTIVVTIPKATATKRFARVTAE